MDNSLKESLHEILEVSSGYGGWYNPNTLEGNSAELVKIIDSIREIAKAAILRK